MGIKLFFFFIWHYFIHLEVVDVKIFGLGGGRTREASKHGSGSNTERRGLGGIPNFRKPIMPFCDNGINRYIETRYKQLLTRKGS